MYVATWRVAGIFFLEGAKKEKISQFLSILWRTLKIVRDVPITKKKK
jgi:hypothetical protein